MRRKDGMSLVILDGVPGESAVGAHLAVLGERLGLPVTRFTLAGMRLAPCLGDFECWTKTPGLCRTRDGINDIARAMHGARLAVFVTPIVFGGYGPELKKAVDRLIGLAHPFFTERDGVTRHEARYERYAPLLFIGVDDGTDAAAMATFRELAAGNAINLMAPRFATRVLSPAAPDWPERLEEALTGALGEGGGDPLPPAETIATACAADSTADAKPPRVAAIFIGSARPKGSSTSESLARELMTHLEPAGTAVALIYASDFIKPGRAAERAVETMLAADLLVVSAPIYVDGLPYLAVRALEQLGERLAQGGHALRTVAGILNCGYPEAVHNRIAMRLLRNFARRGGLAWAGGLALGGGEMIHGRPIAPLRYILRAPVRALRLAGQALAAGQVIPPEAIRLMAKPLVPAGLFRWVARWRWLLHARANRIDGRQLASRPHEEAV